VRTERIKRAAQSKVVLLWCCRRSALARALLRPRKYLFVGMSLSELQQSSYASDLSHIASPLNSARATQSAAAAARRVGISTHGVHIDAAKQRALMALSTKEAEEQARTFMRLGHHISLCPGLGESARRSLPLTLPNDAEAARAAARSNHAAAKRLPEDLVADAFQRIDRNGNGSLSRAEVIAACRNDAGVRSLLGMPAVFHDSDREQFERAFQAMDGDADKGISFHEFVNFFSLRSSPRSQPAQTQPQLRFAVSQPRELLGGQTM
jgi:hypothetical protein